MDSIIFVIKVNNAVRTPATTSKGQLSNKEHASFRMLKKIRISRVLRDLVCQFGLIWNAAIIVSNEEKDDETNNVPRESGERRNPVISSRIIFSIDQSRHKQADLIN